MEKPLPLTTETISGNKVNVLAGETTRISFDTLHRQLREEYVPPSLLINEHFDVIQLSDRAGRYLQVSGGEPTANLLKLILPALGPELRNALYKAKQQQVVVETRQLSIAVSGREKGICIKVRPVLGGDPPQWLMLVLFEEVDNAAPVRVVENSDRERVINVLEKEITSLKDHIRISAKRHEFDVTTLKTYNQNLQSLNEELYSVTEEIQSSKDALFSTNQELYIVNKSLRKSLDEMVTVRNDLDNLIRSVNVGTVFLDRHLQIALYTPVVEEIFHLMPVDYGRPLSDIAHHLEYGNLLQDAEAVLSKLQEIEREIKADNGQVYLVRLSPYRTRDNGVNGVVVTFFNITKHKQAEEALRRSEEKYLIKLEEEVKQRMFELEESKDLLQSVFDTSLVQLSLLKAVRNEQGRILDFQILLLNRELEKETGRTDLIGKFYATEYPGVKQVGLFDLMVQVVETGKPAIKEYCYQHEGFNKWYLSMFVKVDDGLVATNQDISERKAAEQEKLKTLALQQQTEEITKAGSWEYDIRSKALWWSRGMYEIFELPQGGIVSPAVYLDYMVEEDSQLASKLADDIESEHKGVDLVIRMNVHGTVKAVKIKSVPLFNKEKILEKMLGIDLDISASVKAEEELTLQHQQLSEKSEELKKKDEFIGIASHELKTPVTSIKAYAEMLQEIFEDSQDEMNAELMQKLNIQVDRLTHLINALLDTTKISEGKLLLSLTWFDLNALITERVEELQHISHKHKLVLQLAALKPVSADRERISQVLTNLISNAIKYSPQGGEVEISTWSSDGYIHASVRDQGIGIPAGSLNKVFNRFFRVNDAVTKNYPGMGLGLYISEAIIHRHGGTIRAESTPGKGSIFFFTLPAPYSQ